MPPRSADRREGSVTLMIRQPEGLGDAFPGDGGGPLEGDLWLRSRFSADVNDGASAYFITLTFVAADRRLYLEALAGARGRGDHP